jgi:RNA polymerase sigma factor (TIGR02999 family)
MVMSDFTDLLDAVRAGTPGAVDAVVGATYAELRKLARARLAKSDRGPLLDTTSLVNECYLRLVKLGELRAESRSHFLNYAARAMRSIIIDYARERAAQRRGGDLKEVTLDSQIDADEAHGLNQLIAIDSALDSLAKLDERLARVVELRYFAGLTNEEVAAVLNIGARTVRRDWEKARALLYEELK